MLLFGQGHAFDPVEVGGRPVLLQDLNGAHTIAPDGLQQIERISGARPESLGHTAADRVAVQPDQYRPRQRLCHLRRGKRDRSIAVARFPAESQAAT